MSQQTVVEEQFDLALLGDSALHDPAWYHGLTLAERLATLRACPAADAEGAVNASLAQRRLQRWRAQTPFSVEAIFAQRLATEGIAPEQLTRLLGEPASAVQTRCSDVPDWLTRLISAYSQPSSGEPLPLPEEVRQDEMAGVLDLVEPLLRQALNQVRAGIELLSETYPGLPIDPETIEAVLFVNLPDGLMVRLNPTMTLELHVARMQGLLEGATSRERYDSFRARLRCPEHALALLREYPSLARQILRRIDNWAAVSLEFLEHLGADWQALRSTFFPEADPGPLVRVASGLSDPHRGNRTVIVAHFRSGRRLVYKPRSLAVDVHFQELLAWLNERGGHPPFHTLKIVNRADHGWVEFIEDTACASTEEVRRFYQRQGGYLAILYALEATDFHLENLIAAGEQPVLIDLETLFHPRERRREGAAVEVLAGEIVAASVLRVGLLPTRQWSESAPEGIDFSGLGAESGQLTPGPVPVWQGAGTDDMHLIRERQLMIGGHHRPTLAGRPIHAEDYAAEIEAGFTMMYRLLVKHRNALVAPKGPVSAFARDEVRVILRPSAIYATLLRESLHPDLQRDALDRDRFFDRLWIEVQSRPDHARIIRAEREDLHHGDIPVFTTRPGSRDLWSSRNERIGAFFDEAGLAIVQRRLGEMDDDDLTRQLWILRASLTIPRRGAAQPRGIRQPSEVSKTSEVCGELFAAACAIGDRLEAQALLGKHGVGWIGLAAGKQRQWTSQPLNMGLYEGVPGIALFLAHLGAVTGEQRYTALAEGAMAGVRRHVQTGRPIFSSIGGLDAWGGLIYAYSHLASLWQQPALLREAEALVERIIPLIDRDENLDLIGGSAGCIGSLLSLYRCAPSPRILDAAIRCGDRLLSTAKPMSAGIGWTTPIPCVQPLTGFAHGAAGMAWALGKLGALTEKARFTAAARAAIAYERSVFSAEAGNWPDFRNRKAVGLTDHGPVNFLVAWCQGAPGIGLARLLSLKNLGDAQMRQEIDVALETTLAHGFSANGSMDNHSLCHGDLGNLELLLQARETLGEPRWAAEVDRLTGAILDNIHQEGWLCGVPSQLETPGLMTGLAGIGHELLRLAAPCRVPSVLAMAPPASM